MGDPHEGAFDRLEVVVNRLTLQLQTDAREFVDRIAKVETLGRSIDDLRRELRALEEKLVTKEQIATAIELAIAKHMNEELKRGHKSISSSMGPNTKFRLQDKQSSRDFWAKIIVAAIMAAGALFTAYNTVAIKRVESKQEVQDKK